MLGVAQVLRGSRGPLKSRPQFGLCPPPTSGLPLGSRPSFGTRIQFRQLARNTEFRPEIREALEPNTGEDGLMFTEFEKRRKLFCEVPPKMQLRSHFNLDPDDDDVEDLLKLYKSWRSKQEDESVNRFFVNALVTQNWNDPHTSKILKALQNSFYRRRHYLGQCDGTMTFLSVQSPDVVPYAIPTGLPEGLWYMPTSNPILYTNIALEVPSKALESGKRPSGKQPIRPSETLDSFKTRFVHLGVPAAHVGYRWNVTELWYAVVAKLNPAGRVDGIYALPVRSSEPPKEADDMEWEYWEPNIRGVYYLGEDLDRCYSDWILCERRSVVQAACIPTR